MAIQAKIENKLHKGENTKATPKIDSVWQAMKVQLQYLTTGMYESCRYTGEHVINCLVLTDMSNNTLLFNCAVFYPNHTSRSIPK